MHVLEYLSDKCLASKIGAASKKWRETCSSDECWQRRFELLWRDKWNPELGKSRWWIVDANRRNGECGAVVESVAVPPLHSEAHATLRRQLSFVQSYLAALADRNRDFLYDCELAELYDWSIRFRDSETSTACAFHSDGCYEDGVFHTRDTNCVWHLETGLVLLSVGLSHLVVRDRDSWGWHMINRFVHLQAVASSSPRFENCAYDDDHHHRHNVAVHCYDSERNLYRVGFGHPRLHPESEHVVYADVAWVKPSQLTFPVGARVLLLDHSHDHKDEDLRIIHWEKDSSSYLIRPAGAFQDGDLDRLCSPRRGRRRKTTEDLLVRREEVILALGSYACCF